MILIIDFGSQTTHLIARRLRDLGSPAKIVTPDIALEEIKSDKPRGIVLSGGPLSVYESGAPTIDERIFSCGLPMLGICYGFMLASQLLGGKVTGGKKEYGPASLAIKAKSFILKGIPQNTTIWMNHGDEIIAIPKGFTMVGSTSHVKNAAAESTKRKIFMLLFHPEVEHTEYGTQIFRNFIELCSITPRKHVIDVNSMIAEIRIKTGSDYVIGAVSGGVDSSVAGILVAKAIGDKFIPVFVDNGLMREDATLSVQKTFEKTGVHPVIIHVKDEMLQKLRGVTDPERKRKIIGGFYIEVFEREMKKLIRKGMHVGYLLQGTIYSDVIESKGSKHADKIKSHHNVGGLPEKMKLSLLEPLRSFYKDEVRKIGEELGLPLEIVNKQVFPGPGYAVRIRGEVTPDRLAKAKQADLIVLEELKKSGDLHHVYMSFPVLTGAESTAVKGDGRFFGEVIALRIIESKDVMSTVWRRMSYDTLQRLSSRIVNEVPGISRVVYDITTKPPATMEWE